jgi:hypothetical protein
MAWNFDGQSSKTGIQKDWIMEGKVPTFLFKSDPERVRFLMKDVSIQSIMKSKKLSKEEAQNFINTELLWESWIMPVGFWEHSIPSITGKRFYSTMVCRGMQTCPLCAENNEAKDNGVTENKLLPYPIRKRYVAPVYSYRFKKILFVRQHQDFYEDIAAYVEKHGLDIDFDFSKSGKGLNTRYKSIYLGESEKKMSEIKLKVILPKDLDFTISQEELTKRLGGIPDFVPEDIKKDDFIADDIKESSDESLDEDGDFIIPFGSHKGKSIQELFDMGEIKYLEFLTEKASGVVRDKVEAFLVSQAE